MPMTVAYPAVPSSIPSFSVMFMLPISWAMRCCVGSRTAVTIAITSDDATNIVLGRGNDSHTQLLKGNGPGRDEGEGRRLVYLETIQLVGISMECLP